MLWGISAVGCNLMGAGRICVGVGMPGAGALTCGAGLGAGPERW